MKLRFLLILSFILISGCKNIVEDQEMKGSLTIDKSAYGNAFLEFNDPISKQTRFIHPGRKIVKMERKGLTKIQITMMDSRRVQLAKIEISTKDYQSKESSFFVPARSLNQPWDLRGRQIYVPLRVEVHPRSGGKECQLANCQGPDCRGWRGNIFEVIDYRFDYEMKFHPEGTDLVWGNFQATGSQRTSVKNTYTKECRPLAVNYKSEEEKFQ